MCGPPSNQSPELMSARRSLRNQLQNELHLPRRAGFPSWKASVCDSSEGWCADDVSRLTEITMIKQIEDLRPELNEHSLSYLRVLDDREIRVVERRPDYHIATQVAEARDRREYRSIKPTLDGAEGFDWPGYVGPKR